MALFITLNKAEIRQIARFVRSPFFNQKEVLIDLFEYLDLSVNQKKYIPTKEDIFRNVVKEDKYDPQKVRWVMSKLSQLIEHFLVYQEFFEESTIVQTKLAVAFRKKGLSKHFYGTIQGVEKTHQKNEFQDAANYKNAYEIQLEKYNFTSLGIRSTSQNLQKITDNFDVFYIATKLRQCCIKISHQNVYKTEYDFGMLKEVMQYLERKQLLAIPAIGIYYYGYLALANMDREDYFHTFKKLIFEHGNKFSSEEMNGIYLLAINYCIRRLNDGKKSYAQEGLDLYKVGLKSKVLITDGKLSRFTYRNIIAMGLIVEAYDWVEDFLHNYKSALDKEHRESIFNFNLARLEYTRKNYDKALELLNKEDFKDLLLNLSAKTMALKIYYEIEEYRLLDAHLHSMKNFIIRKKIIGYHRTNYLNLIRYTQKLIKLNFYDREANENLRKKITKEQLISEKEWLLEQL